MSVLLSFDPPPAAPPVDSHQGTMTLEEIQKVRNHKEYGTLRPDCMELYLTHTEFIKVFNVNKETFSKLPKWRQSTLKKQFGLF